MKLECTIEIAGLKKALQLAVADMNGDTEPDLVVSGISHDGKAVIMIFKQHSCLKSIHNNLRNHDSKMVGAEKNKRWSIEPGITIKPKRVTSFAVGDVDGDKRNDIVANIGANYIEIFLNAENYSEGHKRHYVNQWKHHISIGKLDDDGIADILVGPALRKIYPDLKTKFGFFISPDPKQQNILEHITELNLDGTTDIVFSTPDYLRLYYGPFSLRSITIKPVELALFNELKLPESVGFLQSGDLNGDNRPDIVASRQRGLTKKRQTYLYLQNMPIGFSRNQEPSCVIDGVCGPIVIGDLNSNGANELCIGDRQKGACIYSLIVENKQYTVKYLQVLNESSSQLIDIAVSDINMDGNTELLILEQSKDKKTILIRIYKKGIPQ